MSRLLHHDRWTRCHRPILVGSSTSSTSPVAGSAGHSVAVISLAKAICRWRWQAGPELAFPVGGSPMMQHLSRMARYAQERIAAIAKNRCLNLLGGRPPGHVGPPKHGGTAMRSRVLRHRSTGGVPCRIALGIKPSQRRSTQRSNSGEMRTLYVIALCKLEQSRKSLVSLVFVGSPGFSN
jgi:hypothetical protein